MASKRPIFDETTTPIDECKKQPSDILDILYDDCFLHVFKYLNYQDLDAVGKCCHRLNKIANLEMPCKFRTTQILVNNPNCQIFKKYATEIRQLQLQWSPSWYAHNSFDSVLKQCTNLKKLSILNCFTYLVVRHRNNFANVLSSLSELHIKSKFALEYVRINKVLIKSSLEYCQQLEKLTIEGDISMEFFKIYYPQLRELTIAGKKFGICHDIMLEFFRKHSNLIKLNLHIDSDAQAVINLSSASVLKNLTDLGIKVCARRVTYPAFNEMPALKCISLNNFFFGHKELWTEYNNLEILFRLKEKFCINYEIATTYPCDILPLSGVINFIKQNQNLEKLTVHRINNFLIWNSDFIFIFPKVIEQLTTEKDAPQMQNFNHLNSVKLYNRPPQYFFTQFDEVSDLKQITIVELSSKARMLLMKNYPTLNVRDIVHIREAQISLTDCNPDKNSCRIKQRLFFSNVGNELSIFRLRL